MSQPPVAACLSEYCRRPERTPREAEVGWFCGPCVTHTRSALLDLAEAHPGLDCAPIPRRGRGGGRGKGGHSDLAVNLQAAETMRLTTLSAHAWARTVCDERDMCGPRDQTTPGLLRWLAAHHLEWFAGHPAPDVACEFVDESARLARAATSALRPPPRRVDPGMTCTEHATSESGERVPCPGQMVGRMTEGLPDMVCTADRSHRLTPAEYMAQSRRAARANNRGNAA